VIVRTKLIVVNQCGNIQNLNHDYTNYKSRQGVSEHRAVAATKAKKEVKDAAKNEK